MGGVRFGGVCLRGESEIVVHRGIPLFVLRDSSYRNLANLARCAIILLALELLTFPLPINSCSSYAPGSGPGLGVYMSRCVAGLVPASALELCSKRPFY